MNTCPHDPVELLGQPIGMYHCPECGEMVVAGVPHPDYSFEPTEVDWAIASGYACPYPRPAGREYPEPPEDDDMEDPFA